MLSAPLRPIYDGLQQFTVEIVEETARNSRTQVLYANLPTIKSVSPIVVVFLGKRTIRLSTVQSITKIIKLPYYNSTKLLMGFIHPSY